MLLLRKDIVTVKLGDAPNEVYTRENHKSTFAQKNTGDRENRGCIDKNHAPKPVNMLLLMKTMVTKKLMNAPIKQYAQYSANLFSTL